MIYKNPGQKVTVIARKKVTVFATLSSVLVDIFLKTPVTDENLKSDLRARTYLSTFCVGSNMFVQTASFRLIHSRRFFCSDCRKHALFTILSFRSEELFFIVEAHTIIHLSRDTIYMAG